VPVITLTELDTIDVRNLNELSDNGVIDAHELVVFTKQELLAIPNFGTKAVGQCRTPLEVAGFEHPDWS